MSTIAYDDFDRVEMTVATITAAEEFARARKPSWRLTLDLGDELGERQTSVQATNYSLAELVGLQVVAVTNFEPKNIAGFMSEVLVLGVPGQDGISLLTPSRPAANGGRVY